MRIRKKKCDRCNNLASTLFRCRWNNILKWNFICEKCLVSIKIKPYYKYGGTWKEKKL